jgi:endonuclease/exonuclease/phosphatase family metal-dependent hydrolase
MSSTWLTSAIMKWVLACLVFASACLPDANFADPVADRARAGGDGPAMRLDARELRVLTWNIEWLGDLREGPSNEAHQLGVAQAVLAEHAPSLAALQEITTRASADALRAQLPGHALSLSSYAQSQQTALLFDARRFERIAERSVEGLSDAGRAPLEVELRAIAAPEQTLIVIVLHAKAGDDSGAWVSRERLAHGLRAYLDRAHPDRDVIVLGDFNDGFTGSTVEGYASPYAALITDGGYVALTAKTERGREPSTRWGATVDHIVVSRSLRDRLLEGSVNVQRDELEARYPGFFESVSDHAPVTLALTWP